jgi:excisionase family DNA binding protein
MNPITISIAAATQRYGIGRSTIYELMKAGAVRSVKIGGRRLIVVASADAYFTTDQRAAA